MLDRKPVIGSFSSLIVPAKESQTAKPQSPLDLLVLISNLQKTGSGVFAAELLTLSGLRLDELGGLLDNLTNAGFVEKTGSWGKEIISATDLGRKVVELSSRPK